VEFPDNPEMRVSPETIYQSLYVQSRGALRRELASARPPEVADRAVPGHWQGDLLIGKPNTTAIGTLVERTSGYTMLVHLPEGYTPEKVRDALAEKIKTLPDAVRLSLT